MSTLCRDALTGKIDCSTTPLAARRLWTSTRDTGSMPYPGRWASVETVGRQWLAAGRPIVWRLFELTEGETRVIGAMVRATNSDTLEKFLDAVGQHTRSRPKTGTVGRVVCTQLREDGTIGGWPTAQEYVAAIGPLMYPGWRLAWRYGADVPVEAEQCSFIAMLNLGTAKPVTLIATAP